MKPLVLLAFFHTHGINKCRQLHVGQAVQSTPRAVRVTWAPARGESMMRMNQTRLHNPACSSRCTSGLETTLHFLESASGPHSTLLLWRANPTKVGLQKSARGGKKVRNCHSVARMADGVVSRVKEMRERRIKEGEVKWRYELSPSQKGLKPQQLLHWAFEHPGCLAEVISGFAYTHTRGGATK